MCVRDSERERESVCVCVCVCVCVYWFRCVSSLSVCSKKAFDAFKVKRSASGQTCMLITSPLSITILPSSSVSLCLSLSVCCSLFIGQKVSLVRRDQSFDTRSVRTSCCVTESVFALSQRLSCLSLSLS